MPRHLPVVLIGLSLAGYLLATVASQAGGWAVLVRPEAWLALSLLLAPLGLPDGGLGVRRGRLLLVLLGVRVILLGGARPASTEGLTWQLAAIVVPPVVGGLSLDLALQRRRPRGTRSRWLLWAGLGLLAALGVLASLPPLSGGGRLVLVPARWQWLARHVELPCWALAWGLYGGVRERGLSVPVDRRGLSLVRASLGLGALTLLGGLWLARGELPEPLRPWRPLAGLLQALGGWVVGLGHYWLLAPAARPRLGPGLRRVAERVALLLIAAATGGLGGELLGWPAAEGALLAAGALAVALAGQPVVRRRLGRWLAPAAGRWLEAARQSAGALQGRGFDGFEQVVEAALAPWAELDPSGPGAWILWWDPPREMRLEPSGSARLRRAEPPEPLRHWAEQGEARLVSVDELEPLRVRRREARELLEVLEAHGALCAVLLGAPQAVEGVLLLPRAGRRTAPSDEERAAFVALGEALHGALGTVASVHRAQQRAGRALRARDELGERLDELERERDRLAEENRLLRAGRGAGRAQERVVALSAASRELRARVEQLGGQRVPVWLQAEGGLPVDRVAWWLHEASGRRQGPFVVADCASVTETTASEALFGGRGDDGRPRIGWLQVAEGGTLLLADVPALPLEVQRQLAEVLATHHRPLPGGGSEPCDVRLVASGREPLARLLERGAVAPELGERLAPVQLRVPPLRERREEIESLALLLLGRARRLLGREPVGLAPEALARLLDYPWPGNERELQFVMEQVALRAEGERVAPDLLTPWLLREERPAAEAADLPTGSFAEIERGVLARALREAGGNKSEAARRLGLKRSTFLDKLRRHGLA